MVTATKAPIEHEPSAQAGRAAGRRRGAPGVGHTFGELEVLDGDRPRGGAGEVLGLVGPVRLRQVHPARARRRPARAEPRADRRRRRDGAPTSGSPRCAYMPQRDLLLPWLSALDNAALAPRNRAASPREARARRRRPLFERFGLAGFEAARPGELSGGMRQRVAFLRTLLAEQAGAAARRAVRLARRDHARRDAGVAGQRARGEPATTVLLVTHDVEEALYLVRPRRSCSRRAPGRGSSATVASPAPRSTPAPRGRHLARVRRTARERALAAARRRARA